MGSINSCNVEKCREILSDDMDDLQYGITILQTILNDNGIKYDYDNLMKIYKSGKLGNKKFEEAKGTNVGGKMEDIVVFNPFAFGRKRSRRKFSRPRRSRRFSNRRTRSLLNHRRFSRSRRFTNTPTFNSAWIQVPETNLKPAMGSVGPIGYQVYPKHNIISNQAQYNQLGGLW